MNTTTEHLKGVSIKAEGCGGGGAATASGDIYTTHAGKTGKEGKSGSGLTNGCTVNQNGWVKITTTASGGNSGGCQVFTISNLGKDTSCTVTIGSAGSKSKVVCGSTTKETNTSANINTNSTTTGGVGWKTKTSTCTAGTTSNYGAGASTSGTAKAGYVYIFSN